TPSARPHLDPPPSPTRPSPDLKFASESSSDHTSTHISYAMVYSEGRSRQDLLKSMRARHTYAATDNIIADWRCGDHMQGDEFNKSEEHTSELQSLRHLVCRLLL